MKYYNFFIDDNIFFLRDIYKNNYKNLFDHFYLAGLKKLHDEYGANFTLNLFFSDPSSGFDLTQFPDTYYDQWKEIASWLKLSFHAYAEAPMFPYKSDGERFSCLIEDFIIIKKEVLRFAPKDSFIAPVIVHYFDFDGPDDLDFLKSQGMKVMLVRETGKDMAFCKDRKIFVGEVEFFCNNTSPEEIEEKLTHSIADNRTYLNIGSHEQYFFKEYPRYLPDHFERIERALKILKVNNYRSVFLNSIL